MNKTTFVVKFIESSSLKHEKKTELPTDRRMRHGRNRVDEKNDGEESTEWTEASSQYFSQTGACDYTLSRTRHSNSQQTSV